MKWHKAIIKWPKESQDILFTMINNDLIWHGITLNDYVNVSGFPYSSDKKVARGEVSHWVSIDDVKKPGEKRNKPLMPITEWHYGNVTILEDLGVNDFGQRMVACKCSCGYEYTWALYKFKNGDTKCCKNCLPKVRSEQMLAHWKAGKMGKKKHVVD